MRPHERERSVEPRAPASENTPGESGGVAGFLLRRSPLGTLVRCVASIPASVHAKLLGAFLLVALLLIALGALSLQMIASVSRQSRLLDQARERVDAARQIEQSLGVQMSFTRNALLLRDDATIQSILHDKSRFDDTLARLQDGAPAGERDTIQRLRATQNQVLATVTRIAALIRDGQHDEAMALHLAEGYPLHRETTTLVTRVVRAEEAEMVRLRERVEAVNRRAVLVMGSFAAASIVLALVLGFVTSWSFILPVRQAEGFLGRVATGDFGGSIDVPNRDEFGALAGQMNRMSGELHRLYDDQRRLYTELEVRHRELTESLEQQTATGEILRVISSSPTDVQPVFDTIARSAMRLCDAQFCHVFRFDGEHLHFVAHHGIPPEGIAAMRSAFPMAPSRGSAAGRTILNRAVEHIPDIDADPDYRMSAAARAITFRATLAVPMLRDGVPVGAITVSRSVTGPFSDRQVDLLKTFADQAVIAIENVRLFTELEARNRDLTESLEQQTATGEILRVISSSPTDVQPVFEAIAASATRLCGAANSGVFRFDGALIHLVAHHNWDPERLAAVQRAFPLSPGRGSVTARAILARTMVHTDIATDPEFTQRSIAAAGFRTSLSVPMLRDGQPIGAITVTRMEPRPFAGTQIELLKTFADQAVIAIENVRLFTELEAKNRDLTETLEQQTATSEILRVISSTPTDVQPVFDTIVRNAVRLCSARFGGVYRFDGELIHLAAHDNLTAEALAEFQRIYPRRLDDESIVGRAILRRIVIHVADMETDGDVPLASRRLGRAIGAGNLLVVPMLRESQVIGGLFVARATPGLFADTQVELLKTFADQAVIAIENVRLFTELEARNTELTRILARQTATGEVLRAISRAQTDAQPVFDIIAASALRLCGAGFCGVQLFDGRLIHLVAVDTANPENAEALRRAYPRPLGDSAGGRAIRTRAVAEIADVLEDRAYALKGEIQAMGFRSLLAVPMLREDEPIGAVVVGRPEAAPFPANQTELLQTFADQAVIAIENVRLFQELEARNRDLTESLEQQTATSEILRVISSSPTDIQPIFDTIARSAALLCGAQIAWVFRFEEGLLHFAAHHGLSEAGLEAVRRGYPMAPGRGSAAARSVLSGAVEHIPDVHVDADYAHGTIATAMIYRSIVAVPMLRQGLPVGSIAVGRSQAGLFPDRQLDLLRTFADQAVIAIENVRLFKELEARNRDLSESLEQQTATSEILRVISRSPTDVQPIFESIVTNAARLCDAAFSAVTRLDGGLLHLVALNNMSPEETAAFHSLFPREPGRHFIVGRAVVEGRAIQVDDVLTDPEYDPRTRETLQPILRYRTFLAVPIVRDGAPIGVIGCGRREVKPFTATQVDLLQTFADQAVIAIENVRLFQELEVRNRDLSESLEQQTATSEVLRVISASPTDVQPVLDAVAENAARLCEATDAQIFRVEGDFLQRVASFGSIPIHAGRAISRGWVTGRAVVDRRTIHVHDLAAESEAEYPVGRETQRLYGHRTTLATPLLREGRALGAILIRRLNVSPFSDRQIKLLETFADQAAIAIENVRLFQELEARNAELMETLARETATGEVLRAISGAQTDAQPVFDIIAASALRLCGGTGYGQVALYDGEWLQLAAFDNANPEGVEALRRRFPLRVDGGSAMGRAIQIRAVVQIADLLEDPAYAFKSEVATMMGVRSVLVVPMLRQGEPIGAIAVGRPEAGPFSDKQLELLQTFSEQAVIAVENVRLFKELQARTQELTRSVGELRALGEVSQAVSSTLDLETVLETIVSRAAQLSGSDSGIVYEFDEAAQTFHARATHRVSPDHLAAVRAAPIRLGEGAVGRAGMIREPVQVADNQDGWRLIPEHVRTVHTREGTRSLLAVPLVRDERLLGGLVILRHDVGAFSPEIVTMLQTFAAQSVLAIHNARLFREIQRQKEYADALVQTSPVAIVTMDLRGAVVGWNPGAERLFGYAQAEAIGRALEDLVAAPEMRGEVQAAIRQTLEGERVRAIARRSRRDGSPVDVETSAMPVTVDGVTVGVIAIYHDITELLRARRDAEAANEAKSAFLATVSHEIRTPMNAVIGMSGLLLNTPLTDEQREYAEVVRQSGDALLTVINDVLDFSKIEAGKLELESQPFDLRECVESALDLVASRAAEKSLDLAYLFGEGIPAAIVGDVTRLRQILLNLLSNAVKFTERGEVVLSVSARPLNATPLLHELTFSVRDTGIGIPADRLGRLFQSFSQVDASTTRRYGGTGLGLAISQRLTELMGGRISVTSEVGAGSEFRFTIRAAAAEVPVSSARRDLSGVQPSLRGKRVLVVDDNATNRRILAAQFDAWGMPLQSTGSPREALEWIQAEERFDVAILDMHMPEMDGVTLAREIRGQPAGGELPLVLFTSLGRREARADEQGFAAYLNKPIKPSQLFDALVSVLADRPVHVQERVRSRTELDPDLARRHPLRILLAEDNVVNQKVALRLLGQMGYRADVAANGLEALDAIARQTYDVVFMDVQMPELDGFEASREITRRWPRDRRPRIVAMTANALQGDRELCVAAGMDDYVSKPIRVEELVATLERSHRRAEAGERGAPTAGGEATDPPTGVASRSREVSPAGPPSGPPRDTPPAAATGVIERATVDRLATTMGADFVGQLIDTFAEDARELMATLHRALAASDVDTFRRAAHSLKSNGETLGATRLAARARELEAMARVGSLDGVGGRLEPLTREYELATRALGELRRGLA
jgi:PAS domain S-box-containing protein